MYKSIILIFICISNILMAQIYNPIIDSIAMRDGKKIAADIYLIDSINPRPTILIQTPYNRIYYRLNLPLVGHNIEDYGYNFVITDWRGFYGSSLAYVAGYDRGLDGYDLVEWIAQQPWSNGKIGTYGASALGKIQFKTAKEQPPHLVCCVPLVANPQMTYLEYFPGGVYRTEYVQQADNLGFGYSPWLLSNPFYNFLWQFVENSTFYPSSINVPFFMIGGWYDHAIDQKLNFFNALMQQSPVSSQHKLLMGPWVHGGHGISQVGSSQQGELFFYNASNWNDSLSLRFFDFYLKNVNNGWNNEPVMQYYQIGDNQWQQATSLSAINVDTLQMFLNSDNYLTTIPPDVQNQNEYFIYNPADPSPTYGGSTLRQDLLQGPYDQSQVVESRSDLLIFTSSTLNEPVRIFGKIKITLFVSSNCKDTDFAIRFCDVYPDNRSILINDGIKRMRFRNGYQTSDTASMLDGVIYKIDIFLPHTAYTFLPGHKIRIDISSSNYPKYDNNLNNGKQMYTAGDTIIATNVVYYETDHKSSISLPILHSNNICDFSNSERFIIYPNPTNSSFTISNFNQIKFIEIYDIMGKKYQFNEQVNFNVNNLKNGLYLIKITDVNDEIIWKKLIKN
ncbi:MAG TPA: CocE/NonD family hydrolase [Bacteroidales bacterium]|nr:CocE/NonD family hydrolase [Bacteroidales bacterium]